jgi:hypothetical protein
MSLVARNVCGSGGYAFRYWRRLALRPSVAGRALMTPRSDRGERERVLVEGYASRSSEGFRKLTAGQAPDGDLARVVDVRAERERIEAQDAPAALHSSQLLGSQC